MGKTTSLKEGYKRGKKGVRKGWEKLGEKDESSEERHIWGLRNPVWILEKGVGNTVIFSTSLRLIELWA